MPYVGTGQAPSCVELNPFAALATVGRTEGSVQVLPLRKGWPMLQVSDLFPANQPTGVDPYIPLCSLQRG